MENAGLSANCHRWWMLIYRWEGDTGSLRVSEGRLYFSAVEFRQDQNPKKGLMKVIFSSSCAKHCEPFRGNKESIFHNKNSAFWASKREQGSNETNPIANITTGERLRSTNLHRMSRAFLYLAHKDYFFIFVTVWDYCQPWKQDIMC